jgi:integrase
MYFAALRPSEAVALRRQDCYLPAHGWGRLILEKSRPEANRRWADTASAHDERGLKHRPVSETRSVPIPPELARILQPHIEAFGTAEDGRLFSSDRERTNAEGRRRVDRRSLMPKVVRDMQAYPWMARNSTRNP